MICQHGEKWVLMDGDKVCRLAHPHEIPQQVETPVGSPQSPQRLKRRYEDLCRKAGLLKGVIDSVYGEIEEGNLSELEEEKILLNLQVELQKLNGRVDAILAILQAPKPSFWERIKACLLRGF